MSLKFVHRFYSFLNFSKVHQLYSQNFRAHPASGNFTGANVPDPTADAKGGGKTPDVATAGAGSEEPEVDGGKLPVTPAGKVDTGKLEVPEVVKGGKLDPAGGPLDPRGGRFPVCRSVKM